MARLDVPLKGEVITHLTGVANSEVTAFRVILESGYMLSIEMISADEIGMFVYPGGCLEPECVWSRSV